MIGKSIGTYRIVRQIGKGGMGAVYEAVHERIGQRAAVKVLDPLLSRDQKQVDRFFDEARALSVVPHPGLVKLFDFNRLPDGLVYILMEFLQGESLWARYQRLRAEGRWLTLTEGLRITRQMASALSAVHTKGIIHRDLKPENVIVVPDPEAAGGERAKLLDFGIAKIAESRGVRRTTVGTTLGTPFYMSPEQCKGSEDLTDKSDVYSLGVMLYEMIAGQPPFNQDQGSMIMASHIFREPAPLAQLPAPPPQEICALVNDMMIKDPARRPSMDQIVSRLGRLAGTGQLPDFDPSLISRSMSVTLPANGHIAAPQPAATTRRQRTSVVPLALGVVAITAVLVVLVGVLWSHSRQQPGPAKGTEQGAGQDPVVKDHGPAPGTAVKDPGPATPPPVATPTPGTRADGDSPGDEVRERGARKRGKGERRHRRGRTKDLVTPF